MTSFPGRNGRRRRVLNEEVLSTSSPRVSLRTVRDEEQAEHDRPRYSEAAGVEHHPQVTDFIPRRWRSIAAIGLLGVVTIVILLALNLFAVPIAASLAMSDAAPFDLTARGSIAGWTAAMVLLIASAVCMLIYSIRQHRIDDIRGRYRVWFLAGVACLVLSVNSVAALHEVLASALAHFTGWAAPPDGTVWWLVLAGLPLTWIAVRSLLDARECRLAGALLMLAIGCYATSLVSCLSWLPNINQRVDSSVAAGAELLAHWSLLMGLIAYARYVILDAQGLIPVRQGRTNRLKAELGNGLQVVGSDEASNSYSRHPASTRSSATGTEWVDGTEPESDEYGDEEQTDGVRKLSKADRKRLRKFKAQNRAA
jgi:hypothetical protein